MSRRTLFDWQAKLRAEGGNLAALTPRSTAPKHRRHRQWPAPLMTEIRRLRSDHPNLGKETLHLLLQPFAATHRLPCPSARTIGRLIADAPDKMRRHPHTFGGAGQANPCAANACVSRSTSPPNTPATACPSTASNCAPRAIAATSSPASTCIPTSPGPRPPAATPALPPSSSSASSKRCPLPHGGGAHPQRQRVPAPLRPCPGRPPVHPLAHLPQEPEDERPLRTIQSHHAG